MPRSTKQQVTLLIDADVLAYNAANDQQRVTDWGEGVTSVVMGTLEEGVAKVLKTAEHHRRELGATRYVLCLTHPRQFRKEMCATYKANRAVKPVLVDPIRDELVKSHGAVRRELLEGDDVMGIYATHPKLIEGRKIIVSIDKDMAQVPGELYNPMAGELRTITRDEADYFHLIQTLTGDPTDNYKGCPGVGPKKAPLILAAGDLAEHPWMNIVRAYEAKGLTEEDALLQARLARILRHTDYDFKRKAPILWQPPQCKNPSPSASPKTGARSRSVSGSRLANGV